MLVLGRDRYTIAAVQSYMRLLCKCMYVRRAHARISYLFEDGRGEARTDTADCEGEPISIFRIDPATCSGEVLGGRGGGTRVSVAGRGGGDGDGPV